MAQAVSVLENRPFSLNLLRSLHATLLDSVRGRHQSPGCFRRVQNYVAPQEAPIEQATYVPPVWQQVEPAMDNWERYLHADEKDALVQLAIVKAQFELDPSLSGWQWPAGADAGPHLSLRKEYIPQATHSQYAIQAIDALFDRPMFQTSDFAARVGVSKSTADRILRKLKETGIVHELRPRRGRRAAVMVFTELVQIVEE
jgi:Fic family protein